MHRFFFLTSASAIHIQITLTNCVACDCDITMERLLIKCGDKYFMLIRIFQTFHIFVQEKHLTSSDRKDCLMEYQRVRSLDVRQGANGLFSRCQTRYKGFVSQMSDKVRRVCSLGVRKGAKGLFPGCRTYPDVKPHSHFNYDLSNVIVVPDNGLILMSLILP